MTGAQGTRSVSLPTRHGSPYTDGERGGKGSLERGLSSSKGKERPPTHFIEHEVSHGGGGRKDVCGTQ